jgi:cytoskeletal protein CcmA (bactofilin family)
MKFLGFHHDMKKFWIIAFLFLLCSSFAFAFEGKMGVHCIIPKNQKVFSDLYILGWNVDVQGEVNGNLFILGGIVKVQGPVHGSVFLAGGDVDIDGPVDGDINIISLNADSQSSCRACRMLALYANQNGDSRNDLLAFAVLVDANGNVGGDALMGGGEMNFRGMCHGHFWCLAKEVSIEGTIQNDADLKADSIILDPSAKILGDLVYTSPQNFKGSKRQILGKIIHHYPPPRVVGFFHFPWLYTLLHHVLSAVWLTVVGLFGLTTWLKKPMRPILDAMLEYPWESFGTGLVICFAVPGIGILLIVSILGLPLGFILLGLFAIGVYITRLFASLYIGERLLQILEHHRPPYWQSLPIGVALFTVLTSIPFIGTIVSLITIPLAFGAKFVAGRKYYKETEASPANEKNGESDANA